MTCPHRVVIVLSETLYQCEHCGEVETTAQGQALLAAAITASWLAPTRRLQMTDRPVQDRRIRMK